MQEGRLNPQQRLSLLRSEIQRILSAVTPSSDPSFFPFTFPSILPPSTLNLSLILELINPAQGHNETARTHFQYWFLSSSSSSSVPGYLPFFSVSLPLTSILNSSISVFFMAGVFWGCVLRICSSYIPHKKLLSSCQSIIDNKYRTPLTYWSSRRLQQCRMIAIISQHRKNDSQLFMCCLGVFRLVYWKGSKLVHTLLVSD